jgi:hypothetical protein
MVELPRQITYEIVEHSYVLAMKRQVARVQTFADVGLRAVRERDPKVMLALEKAAEIMGKEEDNQRGQTRRAAQVLSEQIETTETQLWKEAYRTAEKGEPHEAYQWIYGAAAWLAGVNLY